MVAAAMVLGLMVAGALLGWHFIPWVSDQALRRSYDRVRVWWWESCRAYRAFKQECPETEPRSAAKGLEGALGLWRESTLRAAAAGALPRERLWALACVGVKVARCEPEGTERQARRRHSFSPSKGVRIALAGVLACAVGAAAASVGVVPFYGEGVRTLSGEELVRACAMAVLVIISAAALLVAVVCDMRARIIPLEACAVIAGAGSAYQLVGWGVSGLAAGGVFALLVAVGCIAANGLLRTRCPAGAVGQGDIRCMVALSLMSGATAFWGFVASYVLAAAYAGVGCLGGRLRAQDGIPMAPFLVAWLGCSVALSAGAL